MVKTTRETIAQLDFCHLLVLLLLCYSQYSDPLKNIQPAASSGNNDPLTRVKLLSGAEGWKAADPGEKLSYPGVAVLQQR